VKPLPSIELPPLPHHDGDQHPTNTGRVTIVEPPAPRNDTADSRAILAVLHEIERRLVMVEARMPPARLVTVQEAADALSVSPQTIRRWCKDGRLPYVRRGHELRIDLSKVRALGAAEIAAIARGAGRSD
jgi:excisionase family DNA binding protein